MAIYFKKIKTAILGAAVEALTNTMKINLVRP